MNGSKKLESYSTPVTGPKDLFNKLLEVNLINSWEFMDKLMTAAGDRMVSEVLADMGHTQLDYTFVWSEPNEGESPTLYYSKNTS